MTPDTKNLKAGPFRVNVQIKSTDGLLIEEFKRVEQESSEPSSANPNSAEFEVECQKVLKSAPIRRYECENYQSCLDLSASLDWDSFSCEDCNGCINEKLLWRAKSARKSDPELGQLISLPSLGRLRRRL